MRRAGLVDQRGREIFEGDVVRSYVIGGSGYIDWVAKWENGIFVAKELTPNRTETGMYYDYNNPFPQSLIIGKMEVAP